MYGEGLKSPEDVLQYSKVAILAPKNQHFQGVNKKNLQLLLGKSKR